MRRTGAFRPGVSERNSSGRRLSGTGGGESSGEPLPHIFSQQRKRYVVTPLAIDIHIPLAQSLMMAPTLRTTAKERALSGRMAISSRCNAGPNGSPSAQSASMASAIGANPRPAHR